MSSPLIPLIAHGMKLLRGPLRPVQRYPSSAFLPIITIQLSKPHLPGLSLWPRVRPAPVNTEPSALLCYAHGELLGVRSCTLFLSRELLTVSFFTHRKFVFKDTCQQSTKSHSFSFLDFTNLLTWVLLT